MICPMCGHKESRNVVKERDSNRGVGRRSVVTRIRRCSLCNKRYSTIEKVVYFEEMEKHMKKQGDINDRT